MFPKSRLSFSNFVDQRKTKLALILVAISPDIGGLLIKGEKGSGKSSLVRSFANLLPKIEYVEDCQYHCNPNDLTHMCKQCRRKLRSGKINTAKKKMEVVNLPLGATEDAVVGTVNIEKTLKEKKKEFQPGILAKANRNILYIDEVNLLPDHLTDTILDAAARGWNHVEREGISVEHPANFILIGTMPPEEGELRPQLLDRFGLCVNMNFVREVGKRKEIIEKNIQPISKAERRDQERDEKIKKRITTARKLLPHVEALPSILKLIAITCQELEVNGHRPDIVATLTAKAVTAFDGRRIVSPRDVSIGLHFSLSHRTRESGELAPPSSEEIEETLKRALERLKDTIEEERRQLEKKREMLRGEDKRLGLPVTREKPITKPGPRGMTKDNNRHHLLFF
ncbi:MAG: AAA domain-containing protein [Candidatus Korarchaeota archaeon]|nr:AAA domain-containing protein [Candidatus Korarchaeota archaeon]NIU85613.1 AAA domain-containing protein [Candidatus Thorarchaeota archaeon]NIW15716.1 AAA domain-containing protein [Candidatus Thorarchaeota archaeon]NIW53637.1 AAA domain-containing protein [Candidatus Korarchaeota archaeon]